MVSQSSEGDQGNNASAFPYVADEGRFVSFTSDASNLVERDLDGAPDVFVRDLTTGRTERVSISSSGKEPVFPPDDEVIGALMLGVPVSAISADGRFVAFDSPAPNIVPGDTNGAWDVFIRDRLRGVTERVSLAASGTQASGLDSFGVSMSQDGRFVVFNSDAPLVPDDTNSALDVYIRDRLIGRTERVSVSSTDSQGNATSIVYQPHQAVSSDGRYVAFASDATNLVGEDTNGLEDVFVRDRATGITERVTLNSAGEQQIAGRNAGGNGDAGAGPAIFAMSRDGRFVAFQSTAANLDGAGPPGTGNVYLRDRLHATTTRISIAANGVATKASSAQPSISADGRHVAFQSGASNLTSGDNNRAADCFVYDLPPGMTS
jgi:Tol biopolymer transport system component